MAPALVTLLEEAGQDVPAWLRGMAHVANARSLEEEGAIAAGGGGSLDDGNGSSSSDGVGGGGGGIGASSSEKSSTNAQFSDQDFRSTAAAGSWGADRDKTYRSFDDEAYRSLDGDFSTDEIPGVYDDKVDREGDDFALDKEDVVCADAPMEVNVSASDSDSFLVPFKRPEPSRDLQAALKRINGSKKVGEVFDPKVLAALSKRSVSQRIRFEYLGMYHFDDVAESLSSQNRQQSDRRGENDDCPRILMVAEKPSIAAAIADALSGRRGPRQKRGISRALPVYEFYSNSFKPDGENSTRCLITVTSVVGHVFSLAFDEDANGKNEGGSRSYSDPSEFFRVPVVKQEEGTTGKLRVVDHLRALSGNADHLVLWLDCDAEGENIGFEVIGVTRRAFEEKALEHRKAHPDDPPLRRVHRARFSAITKEALRDAFDNLAEPDPSLSRSVDARQELDLRVGVALTRLLTWRCVGLARKHFSPSTKLISYGPCRTPALSYCVDRAREIEAFRSKPFWKVRVSATLSTSKKDALPLRWKVPNNNSPEDSSSFDQRAAEQVVKLASTPRAHATIVHVTNKPERVVPPVGLNTVGLLTAGSKAMGMSPKQVMNVAEKLYSAGFISYPRTETTKYDPKGFDVRSILREHASHPEWGRTAAHLLRTKYSASNAPPRRGHDAGDHPPITPTKCATRNQVGGGAAWRIYDFVSRNFLGSLGDELEFTRSVAELKLEANAKETLPRFELEKVTVDSVGFAGACRWVLRDIGAALASDNRDSAAVFKEGMKMSIVEAHSEQCATKPPRFLQEHELIQLMDSARIGTDASMATHVNNIVDRGYVVLCDETGEPLRPPRPPVPGQRWRPRQVGRYLVPTSLGLGLVDLFGDTNDNESARDSFDISRDANGLSPAFLARPTIRAQMESEVSQIAGGKLEKATVVEQNLAWFEARYNELEASLSRSRINDFARSLRPTKASLRYWDRLGAFEERASEENKGGSKDYGSKSRIEHSTKRKTQMKRSTTRASGGIKRNDKRQRGRLRSSVLV